MSRRERRSRIDARLSNTCNRPADMRWTSSESSPISTTGIFPIRRTPSIDRPSTALSGGSTVFIVTMPGASADSISMPESDWSSRRAVSSTSGISGMH